ncbi:hypothetical protein DFJ67_7087 [Asanoa ferruginea]|uniref:Phytanoyl-CoA dioxygenase PhyH n=1 Tax=Asanoa ferruginea TaxID=53367 RepID=A0A3D9ZUY2_9ACTN|nr:streptomycin biosynthesis protein StrG [Asanoa ferruginea]REG01016.1 hypothetical protein DFJ67_7087 [Asanoa ferruginea]GIF47616.1 hypothetical protein Afe04nite_21550 [Asanoa ferruginea]
MTRAGPTVPWTIIAYDLNEYPFPALVARILRTSELAGLRPSEDVPLLSRQMDQSTAFHRMFYENFDGELRAVYEAFIAEVIADELGEPFCFQAVPTFRVHLPGNVAVGEFHRDADYHHPPGELNYWLPLTPAWDSNTVWIEVPGTERQLPAAAMPGQVVHFDALNLRHGNVQNQTGVTRVSFDFRCIPLRLYAESEGRSVNTGRRFAIGEYYKHL